jgi:Immunoglobulin domain
MNTKTNYTDNSWKSFNGLLAALALALTVPARAETQPAAIPFSDIGARATANYQGDALGVTATTDGARLRCGFQKLEGHATPEGLWLESTKPGTAGRLRLTATALGRTGLSTLNSQPSTAFATTGTVSVEDKLVRFTRPGLTEEYSVSVDGVRQDFIIESPPLNPQRSTLNQSAGDLRVELALSGARAEAAAGGARLRLEGSGRALAYSRLRVEDATGRDLTARLEVLAADLLAVSVADANATYPVRIDPTFSDADWVSLGSGMNGGVSALAVSGTNLYAGGGFTTAGGVPANYIAKWDGSTWSALGSGVNGAVIALAVSGTNLYAGGYFTTAGGAYGIAKWDGRAWSALGSGMNVFPPYTPSVSALAVSGTNLYAGGFFTSAGGVAATNIAKWDGSTWSALGSGMDIYGYVYALAVSGTDLYAGGAFTTAGGVRVNGIAKWDASAWSALGSGFNGLGGALYALAVSGTNLYAGGTFGTAGGVPANSVAKWDGSAWSALGSGMLSDGGVGAVYALAVSGTNLYAGGTFDKPGGVPANNVAKWDGSAWSALGSGVNNYVNALASDGAGHLFVGGNFTLTGTNVSPYIAQANLPSVPTILTSPQSQTAEAGATVDLAVDATGAPPPAYQWYFNGTNLLSCTTSNLLLVNILSSQSGSYTVVVTNLSGAVTSAPAMLDVIAPVARRLVPGVNLMAQAGNFLGLDYRDNLGPTANWATMATMTLSNSAQFYFDLSEPLPPQRFYRAWQTGTPSVVPSLSLPGLVPAITLTGNIGDSWRLDYINQFGPIDAWATLNTVTLTNTLQLYFDVSALGQPQRLYRLIQVP